MRGLLRADLQQLANLGRTGPGRKLLLLLLVAQAFFLTIGGVIGALLESPGLRQGVRQGDTDPALVVGMILMPTLLVLLRVGLGSSARQLFAGPEVPLLLSSPVSAVHLVARGLWRLAAGVMFWCLGFSLVAVYLAARVRLLPTAATWRLPLAMLLLALPPLALVQMVYAGVMRWAASRLSQLVFSALGSVAFIVFFVLVMSGERIAGEQGDFSLVLDRLEAGYLWRGLLAGPARFVVRGSLDAGSATWLAACLAVVGLACAATAAVYRGAFENSMAVSSASARSRGSRRRWPSGLFASLLRKEWLALAQQPARIVGLCLSAGLLGWMAMQQRPGSFLNLVVPAASGDPWLDGLRGGGALLGLTAKLTLFLLPSFAISVFQGESKQWPLIAASPADRRAYLLAKAGTAGLMLAPYLLVTALLGWWIGLPVSAYLLCLALAPPALGALVAPMIAFGCSPFLMRPAEEGELGPRLRTGLGLLMVYPVLLLLMAGGYGLWLLGQSWIEARLAAGGDAFSSTLIFGGAWWLVADLVIWLGWRAARRNAERYFDARA